MARNETNTSQARELTEAELDRVSGGTIPTKPASSIQKMQEPVLESILVSTY